MYVCVCMCVYEDDHHVMLVNVCMCVLVNVCMCVYVCIWRWPSRHASECMYVCVSECMYMCVCVYEDDHHVMLLSVCMCACTCRPKSRLHLQTAEFLGTYSYACMCMYVCMYVCACVCTSATIKLACDCVSTIRVQDAWRKKCWKKECILKRVYIYIYTCI